MVSAAEINNDWNGNWQSLTTDLEYEINNDLDLAITFIWDRIENHAKRENGSFPEKDNYQLLLRVRYEF